MYTCNLNISDLRLWVHLGCSAEEKTHVQPVSIDIQLSFLTPPKGAQTDNLEETICYKHMTELAEIAVQQPFDLIEHLAATIYQKIQQHLSKTEYSNTQLAITVHKLSPRFPMS